MAMGQAVRQNGPGSIHSIVAWPAGGKPKAGKGKGKAGTSRMKPRNLECDPVERIQKRVSVSCSVCCTPGSVTL